MRIDEPLSIFIVDDNEMIKSLLRLMVKSDDFIVVGDAGSERTAKERIFRARPDIVCLDLFLPDSCSLNLLKWVRSILPDSAVLMITACNDIETCKSAMGAGANGFIQKPFNTAIIMDTLNYVATELRIKRCNMKLNKLHERE